MHAERFGWRTAEHLPREVFVSLLKRLSVDGGAARGALVGNSSAGLIEAAATRTIAVNLGPRQAGRERGTNVIDHAGTNTADLAELIRTAIARPADEVPRTHPYGEGRTGERIADLLARTDLADPSLLRKCCTY